MILQNRLKPITSKPSQICITTALTHNKEWVAIHISDNGSSILPELRDRLFDPFFTTKPIGKGTGLGLSISYQIVTEKHDGKLYCHSEPGKDSELVVEIPVRQARLGLDTGWLVIEQIARFTELSVEQLQQLQNQMIQE